MPPSGFGPTTMNAQAWAVVTLRQFKNEIRG